VLCSAPFSHPNTSSNGSSQAHNDHRGALLVCRAGRRQQQRQAQGSVRRTAMHRSTPGVSEQRYVTVIVLDAAFCTLFRICAYLLTCSCIATCITALPAACA
jgi:hypothetical protein